MTEREGNAGRIARRLAALAIGAAVAACSSPPVAPSPENGPLPLPRTVTLPELAPEPIFQPLEASSFLDTPGGSALPDPTGEAVLKPGTPAIAPQESLASEPTGATTAVAIDPGPTAVPTPASSRRSLERLLPDVTRLEDDTASETAELPAQAPTLAATFDRDRRRLAHLNERLERGTALDESEKLERTELQKRMIAHFFLGERSDLRLFSEFIDGLRSDVGGSLTLEILKAGFFQELGLVDRRDDALARLAQRWKADVGNGDFRVVNFSLVDHYGGYRRHTVRPQPWVVRPGELVQLYGEFEGFGNGDVTPAGSRARRYRRSFSAFLTLRSTAGDFHHRAVFLLPRDGTDTAASRDEPVDLFGRFQVPAGAPAGEYELEILAVDLEGDATARATLELSIATAR